MRVAIIGPGRVGTSLGRLLIKKGHDVVYGSRNPTSSKMRALLLEQSAASAMTISDAAAAGEAVIITTPGFAEEDDVQALCRQLAAGTAGKAVLDATNPLMAASSGGGGVETRCLAGGGRGHDASAGAELIQRHLPQAHVFKAFNTLGFEFFDVAETGCGGRPLTMLFAGGDSGSPGHRKAAELVIRAVGFEPVYAGGIRQARNLEALAELYINMAASVRGGARDFHFQVEAIRPTMTKPEATMAEPPLGA